MTTVSSAGAALVGALAGAFAFGLAAGGLWAAAVPFLPVPVLVIAVALSSRGNDAPNADDTVLGIAIFAIAIAGFGAVLVALGVGARRAVAALNRH